MQQKLYNITVGYGFLGVNYCLLDTRFNLVGMGFAVAAAYFFIKALRIKQ